MPGLSRCLVTALASLSVLGLGLRRSPTPGLERDATLDATDLALTPPTVRGVMMTLPVPVLAVPELATESSRTRRGVLCTDCATAAAVAAAAATAVAAASAAFLLSTACISALTGTQPAPKCASSVLESSALCLPLLLSLSALSPPPSPSSSSLFSASTAWATMSPMWAPSVGCQPASSPPAPGWLPVLLALHMRLL